MLFMVIEHFRAGDARAVGERFRLRGRMMPEGVIYHASWMDAAGARCFQIMEAPRRELLDQWASNWEDLVEFKIIPVQASSDYWARIELEQSGQSG
jgi:Protein of unknown function (DUF3303)